MGVAIVPAAAARDGQYSRTPAPLWKLICVRALFFPLLFLSLVPWIAALPIVDQLLILRKNKRCLHDLVCGTVVVRVATR